MQNFPYKIRRANENDVTGILKAHQSSIREVASRDHNKKQISSWSDFLTPQNYLNAMKGGEEYFVATEGNEILGFSSIKENSVMAVYVSKNGIGRGIGKALYDAIERIAIERRLTSLKLTSSLTAKEFYKKLGFTELEEITHTFKAGATVRAFKMEKQLT